MGISHEALTQNRYFILSTLKKAISQEGLGGDINIDIQDMDDLDETKDGFQVFAPANALRIQLTNIAESCPSATKDRQWKT